MVCYGFFLFCIDISNLCHQQMLTARHSDKFYFEQFPSRKKRMYGTFEHIANRTKLRFDWMSVWTEFSTYIFAQLTIGRIFFRLVSGFIHLLSFIFLYSCVLLVLGAKCRTHLDIDLNSSLASTGHNFM